MPQGRYPYPSDEIDVGIAPNAPGRPLRLLVLVGALIAAGVPQPARADCTPDPTFGADTITCSGASERLATGSGDDQIDILGGATLDADASDAVTDVGAAADAAVRGVNAGPGADTVTHDGTILVDADADATVVDVEPALVDTNGDVDVEGSADSQATGIAGGSENDQVTSRGGVEVHSTAEARGTSVELDLVGGGGSADASLTATAVATGLAGEGGADTLTNQDTVEASADATASRGAGDVVIIGSAGSSTGTTADATAVGIDGGNGADSLTNEDTVRATAGAHATATDVNLVLTGLSGGDSASDAVAEAVGMQGGGGGDTLTNDGLVEVRSNADSTTTDVGVSVIGIGQVGASTSPTARGTGLAGGSGADTLTNNDEVNVETSAEARRTRVTLSLTGEAGSTAEAGLFAESDATGVAGGSGADTVKNHELVQATARADARTTDVSVSVFDFLQETVATPIEAVARALGLAGDGGADTIENTDRVVVEADADAHFVDVEVNLVDAAGAGADTLADADATGVAGGDGDDTITNSGSVEATSHADASVVQVNLSGIDMTIIPDLAGAAADLSNEADSSATGVSGGAGDDTLTNTATGTVTASADSRTDATSVSTSLEGVPAGTDDFFVDKELVDASTDHETGATGMAGDAGDDTIENQGSVTATATATGRATSVSASLPLTDLVGLDYGILTPGIAVVGAGTAAEARATGIDGGDDDDTITNSGSVTSDSTADVVAVSVSGALELASPAEGEASAFADLAATLAETATDANATTTGIQGGAGADTVTNAASGDVTGTALVEAHATSVSASVAVTAQGVFAGGASFADATTHGSATIRGIDGGADGDTVHNHGTVDVDATANTTATDVAVSGQIAVESPVAIGLNWTDAGTTGDATSTGVAGSGGNDSIDSDGTILSDADTTVHATTVTVDVAASATGVALSGAVGQAGTTGTATASGIAGGSGSDVVGHSGDTTVNATTTTRSTGVEVAVNGNIEGVAGGAALTDAQTTATSTATGLSGDEDGDQLTNAPGGSVNTTSKADAASTSVSVDLSVTGVGLGAAAALGRTGVTATATSTGMSGGDGEDTVDNQAALTTDAEADAVGATVAVALSGSVEGVALGAALADATTDATADSTALAGGAGNDTLTNSGEATSLSDADATAASIAPNIAVAFVPGGAAIADADATATAASRGMAGGAGNDGLTNTGTVLADATSHARGVSVGVTPLGASLGDAGVTADSRATGMAGDGGDDVLTNEAALDAISRATATGTTVTFAIAGAALGDADAHANATSTAMDGGAGNDTLTHRGIATATSTATIHGTDVNVTAAGAALGGAASDAQATSKGLAGGDGDDTIDSEGAITATSTANAPSSNVNVALVGAALGDTTLDATALSVGIDGEAGDDTIDSRSVIVSTATATTGSGNVSVGLVGDAEVDALVEATATAVGITGGAGNDSTTSGGAIAATATANATSTNVDVELIGAALGDATTQATANATGIADGAGNDELVNTEALLATANATAKGRDVSVNLAGAAFADAVVTAVANATGMTAGAGNDDVVNRAKAEARATSTLDAANTTFELAGAAGSSNSLTARANATGLDGGEGDDHVRNEDEVVAAATATTKLDGSSIGIFGVANTSATANTDPQATGLSGGAGLDLVENAGSLDVDSSVSMTLESAGFEFGGVGSTSGVLTASTRSTGMAGGDDADTLRNQGLVDVDADATLTSNAGTTVIFGVSKTAGEVASADPTAVGMDGGAGDDRVENLDQLDVLANSTVTANKSAYTFGGGSNTDSVLAAQARAIGLAGGAGVDELVNHGTATVRAVASLTADGGTESGIGNAKASARTDARATATGFEGGEGLDGVANGSSMTVTAKADSVAKNRSDTGILFGDGRSDSDAISTRTSNGVDLGDGGGTVRLAGTVSSRTEGRSDADADSDGGDFINGDAKSTADADSFGTSTGIRGGSGAVHIDNLETLEAEAVHTAVANAFADGDGLDGDGNARATAEVDGDARGISLGAGAHEIANDGSLTVLARPKASAFAEADADEQGHATVNATANADAEAEGIRTGNDGSRVTNRGTILVTSNPLARNATGRSNRDSFAVANVDATVTTRADSDAIARGIHTGSGDDVIRNEGLLQATADAEAVAVANADGDGANGDGTARPTADANADATGIDSGAGNDEIVNTGSLTAVAQTDALADADADIDTGIVGNSSEATTDATVVSDADAIGIYSESGDNTIVNEGEIDVLAQQITNTADSYASAHGSAGIQMDSFAYGDAVGSASATGIWTGDGDDAIRNDGSLSVLAAPFAYANGLAEGRGEDGDATAVTSAKANGALAVGIRAGDGDNTVVNTGTLTVRAKPSANALADAVPWDGTVDDGEVGEESSPQEAKNAQAIGIWTGSGDDTIVNEGTIFTEATGSGASNTAIRAGAGADTVELGDGSSTTGAVELGDGDDTLKLKGTPVVDGALEAGAGFDGLVLDGAGSFAHDITGFDSGLKSGAGVYTLKSVNSLQSQEIAEGSLLLESAYAMPPGASYATYVDGDGSSGRFESLSTVAVDGHIAVSKGLHAFADGLALPVVKGSSVSGLFSSSALPAPTPLLSFSLVQVPDAVNVVADAESFTLVARNDLERAVARALDGALPTASGDLSLLLGRIQDLPGIAPLPAAAAVSVAATAALVAPIAAPLIAGSAAHSQALATLGPTGFDDVTLQSLTTASTTLHRVQERMELRRIQLRADRGGLGNAVGAGGADDPALALCGARSDAREPDRRRLALCGVWVSAFGQGGQQDSRGGFSSYEYGMGGAVLGVDYAFGGNLLVGGAAGYAKSRLHYADGDLGDGDVAYPFGSLYATYLWPRAYVEGVVSYGVNDVDSHRVVFVDDIQRNAFASYDSDIVSVLLGGGYAARLGSWNLGPYGSLRYSHLDEDGFREVGAGAANLTVGSRNTDQLVSVLGLRASTAWEGERGVFVPELQAAWKHDYDVDDREIPAAFSAAPGVGFGVSGRDADNDAALISGFLHFVHGEWFSVSARVGTELRPDYTSVFGGLELSGRF